MEIQDSGDMRIRDILISILEPRECGVRRMTFDSLLIGESAAGLNELK